MRYTTLFLIISIICSGCSYISTTYNNTENNKDNIIRTPENTKTYRDKKFKFSVAYPENLQAEVEPTWEATSEREASPDGGINIFIDSKKEEKVYIFGQVGQLTLYYPGFKREEFSTNSGLPGELLSNEANGKIEIHLVLYEGFHGAYINIKSESYVQNKEQIMDILKSIQILNQ